MELRDARIANSVEDLASTLKASRVGFEVARVRSESTSDWGVEDGALQHSSGGFFSVNGMRHGSEEAVLLFQPQAAVTGLLMSQSTGEPTFLLQARAEPGCLGEAQFGPTIQSTPANYLQIHGGATTPHVDAFIRYSPGTEVRQDTSQLDLGKRYYLKTKRSILAEGAIGPTNPNYVWASVESIRDACCRSAFFNIDLRSIFAVMPWTETGLMPRSNGVRASTNATIRPEVLGDVFGLMASAKREARTFCPLTSLSNWHQTEWGWSEVRAKQGFSIEFFKVKAEYREVAEWTQPLVNSASEGCATLACRERNGMIEVFVRVEAEIGLASNAAVMPSYLRYPGETSEPPEWLADHRSVTWSETVESDEGGRFYCDASRYMIKRVDESKQPSEKDGVWMRLSELKFLLSMSNVCSIQLRGLASQFLGVSDI